MKLPPLTATLLRDFENCPHKAYRRYIKRDVKFKRTEAMDKGTADHKAVEDRLARGHMLPDHLSAMIPICEYFSSLPDHIPVKYEYYVGILVDRTPCDTKHDACWLRVKADLCAMTVQGGWLVDWKTGRKWEDPFELECQALVCSAHHKEVPHWIGNYYWIKELAMGQTHQLNPTDTYNKVGGMYQAMFAYDTNGEWPKKPNKLCDWCDVADCTHNSNPECKK